VGGSLGVTVIYTAMAGGFDKLRSQVEQDIECEWVAFVDDPSTEVPAPWEPVPIRSEGRYDSPRMVAKWFKLQPHRLFASQHVIWVDANMEVTWSGFARAALLARHDGFAAWRHPRRECIYAEAEASIGVEAQGGKYDRQTICDQVDAYRKEGHPEHAGLFACGTLAWDLSNDLPRKLADAWLTECELWSPQDQISLPVVARRLGVEPGVFPLAQIGQRRDGQFGNEWLRIHRHRA
jgi:hypothetical protein